MVTFFAKNKYILNIARSVHLMFPTAIKSDPISIKIIANKEVGKFNELLDLFGTLSQIVCLHVEIEWLNWHFVNNYLPEVLILPELVCKSILVYKSFLCGVAIQPNRTQSETHPTNTLNDSSRIFWKFPTLLSIWCWSKQSSAKICCF